MEKEKLKETTPILILYWFGTFSRHILQFCLIVNFVFGYSINFYPYEKGYCIQPIKCKEGYKIYPIQYKEDKDIEAFKEHLKYGGYIKAFREYLKYWGYIEKNYKKD